MSVNSGSVSSAHASAGSTLTAEAITRPSQRRWFESLDGMRFVAAFLVILHHSGFSSGATFRWDLGGLLLTRMDIGVSIFFVLSGFLLYRPFVVAQFSDAPMPATGRFWIRRVVRIFPAYWAAFLILLALGAITVAGVNGFLYSFTLTHVYSPSHAVSGMTQSWSLATELGFYLALPLIAAGARQLTQQRRDGSTRTINHQALRLLVVCAGLAVFSVVFRLVMFELSPYGNQSWGNASRLWAPSYMDIFGAGMALAVISVWAERRPLVRDASMSGTRHVWAWWSFAVGMFWFVSTQLDLERGLLLSSFSREVLRQTIYGVVGLALVVPAVFAEPGGSAGLRLLAWRPIAWLGIVSYAIYLWHQAVLEWTHELLDWPELSGNFLVLVASATVFSAAIAGLSHRFVEEPASRYARARMNRTRGRGSPSRDRTVGRHR